MKPSNRIPTLASAALLVTTLAPGSAEPQVSVAFAGVASQPYSTVKLGNVRERIGGVWMGGSVVITSRFLTLSATGLSGTLEAIDNTTAFERDGGEMGGFIRISPVPWLGFEGGYTARAFNSAAGRQNWNIPHVGATLSATLGHPALRAYFSGAYLPAVSVSGLETPDMGIAGEAALVAEPPNIPLYLAVRYRLERYDFPTDVVSRLEQYDQISVSVGFQVRTKP